ncbi:MAG: M20/M25/M40 family metallo-hydrolase [Gemmatimonadota bacterium]
MTTRPRVKTLTLLSAMALIGLSPAGAGPLAGQTCPDPARITRGFSLPMAAVRYLADDALGGRLAGSADARCAGDYIAATFERLGLEPGGDSATFFQSFQLASTLNPDVTGTGRNVIAVIEGRDPVLRDQYIVIGAHYDHLGHGEFDSLAPSERGRIHNGADDNASGVGALLRVAQLLMQAPAPARSILFIAFTGEESGLLGSANFVAHPTVPRESIVGMINMDMVGRLGTAPLIVNGVDTAEEWRSLLAPAAQHAGIELSMGGEGYGPSDQTSFYGRDIPVLHFFTNVHGDYHKPTDDWEKIDGAGIGKVADIVTEVAAGAADREPVLTLVRGQGTPPAPAGSEAGRGYGPRLGIVPDFTPVDRGVPLSGVSPGSPAEEAGLQAGDVIVAFGDHELADLMALMEALRSHKPGDVVQIHLLRDGKEMTVEAKLGASSTR